MSELIEKRPLAYGFIEDGNLHNLIKWPFMEEVSVFINTALNTSTKPIEVNISIEGVDCDAESL